MAHPSSRSPTDRSVPLRIDGPEVRRLQLPLRPPLTTPERKMRMRKVPTSRSARAGRRSFSKRGVVPRHNPRALYQRQETARQQTENMCMVAKAELHLLRICGEVRGKGHLETRRNGTRVETTHAMLGKCRRDCQAGNRPVSRVEPPPLSPTIFRLSQGGRMVSFSV